MIQEYDSAAWTGRTVESRWSFYIGRRGFEILYGWRERDLPMGRMCHTYGMMMGRDFCRDYRGLFFHWNYWQRGLVWI